MVQGQVGPETTVKTHQGWLFFKKNRSYLFSGEIDFIQSGYWPIGFSMLLGTPKWQIKKLKPVFFVKSTLWPLGQPFKVIWECTCSIKSLRALWPSLCKLLKLFELLSFVKWSKPYPTQPQTFTCGLRPTGHRVIQIVVVVVIVGGEHLLYMGTGRAHVWSFINQSITPALLFYLLFQRPMYGLDAHVCWGSLFILKL